MSFKLLKDIPGIKTGDIISSYGVDYEGKKYYFKKEITISEEIIIANPDWFAPYLFTTEDGVDIYTGDYYFTVFSQSFTDAYGDFIEANKVYGENIANCDKTGFVDYVKLFSTKQAAEKYLEPKFKVGDYFVYDDEIYKIDNIKISSFISDNKAYDKALCRKATNEEIIKYYQNLGWVEGAKFEAPKPYPFTGVFNDIVFRDNFIGLSLTIESKKELGCDDYKLWDIEDCKLIKESNFPKSFKDLKRVHGYVIGENCIFRDFEYCNNYVSHKIFKTQKQAESATAFAQLSQLVAEMNGDWQPNWNDHNECKYVIDREFDTIYKGTTTVIFHPLAFKTAEARDFSFQHHEKYWKTYYQL